MHLYRLPILQRTITPFKKYGWQKILLPLFLLLGLAGQALHIKGGWIYYTYLGPVGNNEHRYLVNLKVYRDCATPNPGQNDTQINFSVYTGGTTFYRDFPAPLTKTYPIRKTSYSECVNPKPEVCYVILEYETEIVLPAAAGGYTLSFQRCCRINGIVNVLQPSNTLGNTYSVTIPGTATLPTGFANSSPQFNLNDTVLVCYSSPITLDYGAIDNDKDSLDYYFIEAYIGADQGNPNPQRAAPPPYGSLPYAPGYSPGNPFGTNLKIDNRTGLITGRTPSVTGEFVLAVGVDEYRNGKKIATTRKELHVNVANCAIAAAQLPVRITSCDGFTVQFENLSSSPAVLSYYWDFGVKSRTDDTSVFAVPQYTYPDTGIYTAKLVVNKGSTCSDSATTEVRVFPGFFPAFASSGSCYLNDFVFSDQSTTRYGKINYWRWDFGNTAVTNDTSLLRNPVYRYPGIGNYTASLIVASDKGCIDTISAMQVVTDKPNLKLGFRDTLICSIDTLQLVAIGSGTFQWTPTANLLNPASATPLVFPKNTTYYFVTLTENGCTGTDSVKVNVINSVSLDAGPDTTLCLTDPVTMRPVTNGLYFNWQPASIFAGNTLRNAVATPVAAITRVQVTASVGKCRAVDSLILRTVPYPQVNAGNDTIICYADTVLLRGSTNGSTYAWSPTALVKNPAQLSTLATPLQTTTFVLTVTDNKGCPKPVTDNVLVTVRPRVVVNAGNDTTVVYNQRLQFNATSTAGLFSWSPTTGLSNPTIANPVAVYTAGTIADGSDLIRYTVTARTPEGCAASDDIVVRVFKTAPSIFVPNAFTPNGDGLNDLIKPVLAGIQRLEFFRIYNRYGELVFETRESGKGWDGRIQGQLQASNAYVYQVKAIDYQGETIFNKGTFVLIR